MSSNYAIVYQWWNDRQRPHEDITHQVYATTALLRYHNPDIKVYVLNYTDWEWQKPWLEMLNMQVIDYKQIFQEDALTKTWVMPRATTPKASPNNFRAKHILKLANEIPEDNIIFSDVDVFWRKNPLPLFTHDQFNIIYEGAGFFHFNKQHPKAINFLHGWKDLSAQAYANVNQIGDQIYDQFNRLDEETVYYFFHHLNQTLEPATMIPKTDHSIFLVHNTEDLENSKCIHFHATHSIARGCLLLLIKEFYDCIRQVLPPTILKSIYGKIYNDAGIWNLEEIITTKTIPKYKISNKLRHVF